MSPRPKSQLTNLLRSIITSTTRGPRRTLALLRNLPSYLCPSSLFVPTILHALVHPVLALSTPLVLRTKFRVDSDVSPTTFSLAKFLSSTVALFINLPLETVLRRGQVSVLSQPAYVRAAEGGGRETPSVKGARRTSQDSTTTATSSLELIVPPGRYDGVFGTMYAIVNEEGSKPVSTPVAARPTRSAAAAKKGPKQKGVAETVYRRGQGVEGLWRGWKVSWWGLVGLWGAAVVGGGGDGEF